MFDAAVRLDHVRMDTCAFDHTAESQFCRNIFFNNTARIIIIVFWTSPKSLRETTFATSSRFSDAPVFLIIYGAGHIPRTAPKMLYSLLGGAKTGMLVAFSVGAGVGVGVGVGVIFFPTCCSWSWSDTLNKAKLDNSRSRSTVHA